MNEMNVGAVGAVLILINAIVQFLVNAMTVRRTTKTEDQAEGARRLQLTQLVEIVGKHEGRWDEQRRLEISRSAELQQTQETVRKIADTQATMAEDLKAAVEVSQAASKAVTDLATGLAVKVSFGSQRAE